MTVYKIDTFSGKYFFLSNFYQSLFKINGKLYSTNEHFFQAHKTLDKVMREKIISCSYPAQAKKLGRRARIRPEWCHIRTHVMKLGIRLKFGYNYDIKQRLIDTGDRYLEEGNHWHDNYWGNCKCGKCKNKEGKNILGNLLMQYREEALKGYEWEIEQVFDMLDAIKMCGVYSYMLSAIPFIKSYFKIDEKQARTVLWGWTQDIKKEKNNDSI